MQCLRYSSSLLPIEELSLFKIERRQPSGSIRNVNMFECLTFDSLPPAWLRHFCCWPTNILAFGSIWTRERRKRLAKKLFSFRLLALFHQLCFWSFSSQIQIFCTRNCFLGWIFMFPSPHPTFLMQLKLTFFGVKKSCTSYLNWGWGGGRGRGNSGNVRKKTFFREVYPKFGKVTPTICNCCFGGRQSFQSSKVEERI